MQKILETDNATKKHTAKFTPFFERLLHPINQWVLTEILDDWKSGLNDINTVEDYRTFAETAREYLDKKRREKKADTTWLRCIIYISLQRLSRNLEDTVIWTRNFIEQPGNKAIDANEEVLKVVLELYNKWRDDPEVTDSGLAQPYAFYLLFEVVTEDGILHKYIEKKPDEDPLRMYLQTRINGNVTMNNRLVNFAAEFYKNGKTLIAPVGRDLEINPIGHFHYMNLRNVNVDHIIDANADKPVKVTLMGIMGSGKTTIIKRIRHVVTSSFKNPNQDSHFAITQLSAVSEAEGEGESLNYFGPISKRTSASKLDRTELAGEIRISNKQYTLSFNDLRGGIMLKSPPKYEKRLSFLKDKKYPLEELLVETDLLVLVLDPETIFYEDPDEIFTFENLLDLIAYRLKYLFHTSEHAMIAIVFTKFDEYGSVIRGPRNLIHNSEQGKYLKDYMDTGDEQVLNKLINTIGKSYQNRNQETPLQQTVELLLNRIRYLLKSIIHLKQHTAVNLYIASTASLLEEEKSTWTGIPDVFNDFADYMKWISEKKKMHRILPPGEVKISIDSLKPVIEFLNPNQLDVLGTLERKESDGEFLAVQKDKTVHGGTKSAFTDNNAAFEKKYTYRLYFMDRSEDRNVSKYSEEKTIETPKKPLKAIEAPVGLTVSVKNEGITLKWSNSNKGGPAEPFTERAELEWDNNVAVVSKRKSNGVLESLPVFFTIERKTKGVANWVIIEESGKCSNDHDLVFLDPNIEGGKEYTYRVKHISEEGGESNYAESLTVRTPPLGIKNLKWELKTTAQNVPSIELSWETPANVYPTRLNICRKVVNRDSSHNGLQELKKDFKGESFKDMDVQGGRRYLYRIVTFDPDNPNNPATFEETEMILIRKAPTNMGGIIIIALVAIVTLYLLIKVSGLL